MLNEIAREPLPVHNDRDLDGAAAVFGYRILQQFPFLTVLFVLENRLVFDLEIVNALN